MSIIALPTALRIGAGGGMGQARFDLLTQSDGTGAQQARLLAPPRWTLRLVQPDNLAQADAAVWQALALRLRGRVNVLAAWDVSKPAPLGTMRGSMALSAAAAAGATSISVTAGAGQAATTLAAGDWLQVGAGLGTSQLVMVTAAAVANGSGVITPSIEPPLRQGYASATAVAWDRPLAYFRQQTDATTWTVGNGGRSGALVTGMSMDLMESWS